MRTNLDVMTPYGKGTIQGRWPGDKWLVRVAVTDANRGKLGLAVTPHAVTSALWAVPENELKAAG